MRSLWSENCYHAGQVRLTWYVQEDKEHPVSVWLACECCLKQNMLVVITSSHTANDVLLILAFTGSTGRHLRFSEENSEIVSSKSTTAKNSDQEAGEKQNRRRLNLRLRLSRKKNGMSWLHREPKDLGVRGKQQFCNKLERTDSCPPSKPQEIGVWNGVVQQRERKRPTGRRIRY